MRNGDLLRSEAHRAVTGRGHVADDVVRQERKKKFRQVVTVLHVVIEETKLKELRESEQGSCQWGDLRCVELVEGGRVRNTMRGGRCN